MAAEGRSDLALPSVLLYLAAYAVTNLGAFAVVCALPQLKILSDYRGLLRRYPWLAVSLVVCLLGGLSALPPRGYSQGSSRSSLLPSTLVSAGWWYWPR